MAATHTPNPGGTQPADTAHKAGQSRDDDGRTGQTGGVQAGAASAEGGAVDQGPDDDKTPASGGDKDGDLDGFEMIRKHHGKLHSALGDADSLRACQPAQKTDPGSASKLDPLGSARSGAEPTERSGCGGGSGPDRDVVVTVRRGS